MAATLNGKKIALHETIIVQDGDVVDFGSQFPLEVRANGAGERLHMAVGPTGGFILNVENVTGLDAKVHLGGSGHTHGVQVRYRIYAEHVAQDAGRNITLLNIMIFEI